MKQLIARVRDDAHPENERANLQKLTIDEFREAFAEDSMGALRCYPFGLPHHERDATVLTDGIVDLYRAAAIETPEHARIAMEMAANHPYHHDSPRKNIYSDGLMRTAGMTYPEALFEHVQQYAGVPAALYTDCLNRALAECPAPVVTEVRRPRDRGVRWPGIEDTRLESLGTSQADRIKLANGGVPQGHTR
jgi:hypothetical protein